MKPEAYAQALYDLLDGADERQAFAYIERFKALLESRDLSGLYPMVIAHLEKLSSRKVNRGPRLVVANHDDSAAFWEEINNAAKRMNLSADVLPSDTDETLIGGFRIETDSELYDASYKKNLIELYRTLAA